MKLIVLGIQELHGPFFQVRLLEFVVGTVGIDELVAGYHAPHLGAIQCLTLSRFGKLESNNDIWCPVQLDLEAFA